MMDNEDKRGHLFLDRRVGEKIVINGNITVVVIAINHVKCRIGVSAPRDVAIERDDMIRGPKR